MTVTVVYQDIDAVVELLDCFRDRAPLQSREFDTVEEAQSFIESISQHNEKLARVMGASILEET